MMEPCLAVQTALFGSLNGSISADGAAVPIYDRVPDAAATPYVEIGDDQAVPDKAEGLERSAEITSTIHVFSYGGKGRAGSKAIVAQIVDCLEDAELDVSPEYRALITLHDGTRYLDEPDGKTVHAVVTFRTLLDAV